MLLVLVKASPKNTEYIGWLSGSLGLGEGMCEGTLGTGGERWGEGEPRRSGIGRGKGPIGLMGGGLRAADSGGSLRAPPKPSRPQWRGSPMLQPIANATVELFGILAFRQFYSSRIWHLADAPSFAQRTSRMLSFPLFIQPPMWSTSSGYGPSSSASTSNAKQAARL